jgi:hypothetical protein
VTDEFHSVALHYGFMEQPFLRIPPNRVIELGGQIEIQRIIDGGGAERRASERIAFATRLMLGVPLRAGPSHVMMLGPVIVAGAFDQLVPARHHHIEAAAKQGR